MRVAATTWFEGSSEEKLITGSESQTKALTTISPTICHFGSFRPERPIWVTAWVRASCMAPRLVTMTATAQPPR